MSWVNGHAYDASTEHPIRSTRNSLRPKPVQVCLPSFVGTLSGNSDGAMSEVAPVTLLLRA
eukprot:1735664-Amphidinium_carterae.1